MYGLSVYFPLQLAEQGFATNKTLPDLIKQNLKFLFLTLPGEKIMDPQFGVGLEKFLFENDTPVLREAVRTTIIAQTKLYMPHVDILAVHFVTDSDNNPEVMKVVVEYRIVPLQIDDALMLPTQANLVVEETIPSGLKTGSPYVVS